MKFNIKEESYPIIIAAIHDGHEIREELQKLLILNEESRLREEDPFTGEFLSISPNSITTEDSRFEVDLNRPREKAVYLKPEDSWGLTVWNQNLPEDFYLRSISKFDSFYSELKLVIDSLLKENSHIVIYDIHSYNYKRNGADKPAEADILNPEINLGTGTLDRNKWAPIIDKFIDIVNKYNFMGRTLDIRENIKFKGGFFPRWVHEMYPDNVCVLSIEFRKFFMDEWSGVPDNEVINQIKIMLKYSLKGIEKELLEFNNKRS